MEQMKNMDPEEVEKIKQKVMEMSPEEREELLKQAKDLEEAGCFSIILEAIPHDVAKKITNTLKIPTIGIGAGPHCDGQVLVCYDMLGCTTGHKPKFVKKYANLRDAILKAVKDYAKEVEDGDFPTLEYSYGGQ